MSSIYTQWFVLIVCLLPMFVRNECANLDSAFAASQSALDNLPMSFAQLKRSGFLPMRGRKWMDDTLPAASADDNHNAINARLHLLRAFLDQLVDSKSIDEKSTLNRYSSSSSSPLSSSSSSSFDLPNIGRTKKHPIGVQSDVPSDPVIYSYPMAGWYGPYLINSPKRAGFLPMRGRKSDPGNQLSMEDHQSPANDFLYTADEPEKRAGFMPMRGKKQTQEISAKRAFHALRG